MLVNQIVLHRINPFYCSFPFNSLEVFYSRVLLYPCCYASQTLRFFCFCEPVWPSSWTATTSTSPTSPSATAEATLSQNRFRSACIHIMIITDNINTISPIHYILQYPCVKPFKLWDEDYFQLNDELMFMSFNIFFLLHGPPAQRRNRSRVCLF